MAVGETRKQGIKCKKCGCRHFLTVDTWHLPRQGKTRRRKQCRHCGWQVITTEKIEEDEDGDFEDE